MNFVDRFMIENGYCDTTSTRVIKELREEITRLKEENESLKHDEGGKKMDG